MTSLPPGRIVADASLLIAIADQDPAAQRFVSILNRCDITAVNFGEVCYELEQKTGVSASLTESTFTSLGVLITPVDVAHAKQFPALKQIDRSSRGTPAAQGQVRSLSLADMVCLAHGLIHGLPVLTGDRHWTTLSAHGLKLAVFDYRDAHLTV